MSILHIRLFANHLARQGEIGLTVRGFQIRVEAIATIEQRHLAMVNYSKRRFD